MDTNIPSNGCINSIISYVDTNLAYKRCLKNAKNNIDPAMMEYDIKRCEESYHMSRNVLLFLIKNQCDISN